MESNIKQEPAVEFELLLPAIDNPFGIKDCYVLMQKFDEKWKKKLSIFAVYNACGSCEFVSRSKNKFQNHEKKCGSWGVASNNVRMIKSHREQLSHGAFSINERQFKCDQCQKTFKKRNYLHSHKSYTHNFKRMDCDICGKMWKTKLLMIGHLETHIKEKCDFCGKMLIKSRMADHVNREHVKSERSMSCKDCGKRFLNKQNFNIHINSKPKTCHSCQITFNCPNSWRKHIQVHNQNGFKCNQCSYVAKSMRAYKRHCKLHEGTLPCESCDQKFSNKLRLKYHQIRSKHGPFTNIEQSFACNQCEKIYPRKNYLDQHKHNAHKFEFECDTCGKILKRKRNMIRHLKTHIGEKCKFCSKMFTRGRMPFHVNREHKNQFTNK